MKGKYGSLIRDLLFFTISTFVPKAISFFLVPLYTNCLTTAEYGIADLLSTTVSLAIPFLTLDINDAVLRFTIENKEDERPFQIAIKIALKGAIIIGLISIINCAIDILKIDNQLMIFFFLNYISVSLYGIGIAYLRATDQVELLSLVSILITLITVLSNIFFLVILHCGLIGYMISGVLGYVVADLIILVKIKAYSLLRKKCIHSKELEKQMVNYSMPLIAANVSWWINSSSDRYFVTAMRGVDANGIYSVAYKIPTILQMLQSVFSQAWLLSVYREYKSENGAQYVSKIYEIYYVAMGISCAGLIILDIPLAKFLYAKDFFEAWKYVPCLLISVVFIANAGFFESMLTLYKKTKIVAATTAIGAVVNIILNIILINSIGVMGAAIATICGYFVMWIIRIKPVMQEYNFRVNWFKCFALHALLLVEAAFMILYQNYIVCITITAIMCLMNWEIVKQVVNQVTHKLKV